MKYMAAVHHIIFSMIMVGVLLVFSELCCICFCCIINIDLGINRVFFSSVVSMHFKVMFRSKMPSKGYSM